VPLAEDSCLIADGFQCFRDGDFVAAEEKLVVVPRVVDVLIDVAAAGRPSGHQAGPRGRAKALDELYRELIPQDLIKFGLIPELVGRIPVVATFHDLTEKDLVDILTKPKNAIIRQYQKLFETEGIKLEFTREALNMIARRSMEKKLGARGLRSIIEDLMVDLMFYLPSLEKNTTIKITKKMVEQNQLTFRLPKQAVGV